MRLSLLILFSLSPCLLFAQSPQKKKVDLVELGKELFHSVGCAECHTEAEGDPAVKTGPGLYGLFQKKPRSREVIEAGEEHRRTLKADFAYFKSTLRAPVEELAVHEAGETKGQPYLPVMPPYTPEVVSDFKMKAIHQYLLTLNKAEHRGPAKVMVEDPGEDQVSRVVDAPNEILVTDQTRIYRARLAKSSARAIFVGMPSGLNYSFDPRTLSFERVWWGGFLDLREEMNGRARNVSKPGHQAEEIQIKGSLLLPHHPKTGHAVDLSFQSPVAGDYETIDKNLYAKTDFLTQLAEADAHFRGYARAQSSDGHPVFGYQVGDNHILAEFSCQQDGSAQILLKGSLKSDQTWTLAPSIVGTAKVSEGKLTGGTWTLPAQDGFSVTLTFTLPAPKKVWRPAGVKAAPKKQTVKAVPLPSLGLPKGYRAEAIPPPLDPHGRPQLFEALGMDFTADGALIVSTRTAGMWRYQSGSWTQVAEGLLDSLGLIVEDDKGHQIVVGQKAELTRLVDQDGDGVMDLYETLCDDFLLTSNYHEYLHGPAKDKEGNYYVALNLGERKGIYKAGGDWMGTQGGLRGWCLQINSQGAMSLYARGLRSPAGLATSPGGDLLYTENQGEYVGTSKMFALQQGKFYGHPSSLVDLPGMTPKSPDIAWEKVKPTREAPLALLAHSRLANSPGSPAWDTTSGKFGPFAGQMFLGDQTLSNLFRVIPKSTDGVEEAAMIPFAQKFPSGVMRMAFAPDGSLYVGQTGRGWRARGGKDHSLVRIVPTSEFGNQLYDLTRQGNVFTLTFTQPLQKAPSVQNLKIRSWTYIDSPKYGSKETDVREDHIKVIKLSADQRSLEVILKDEISVKSASYRIYHFLSKELPVTNGDKMEAFYSYSSR